MPKHTPALKWKMRKIHEDMIVCCDKDGNDVSADSLQRWAYNQLEAAPEMYEVLQTYVDDNSEKHSFCECEFCEKARALLARIDGEE